MTMTPTQEALKERLTHVRGRMVNLNQELCTFREEEEKLIRMIVAKKERCQICLGRGSVKQRDPGSGQDVLGTCYNCKGTGTWEAPV